MTRFAYRPINLVPNPRYANNVSDGWFFYGASDFVVERDTNPPVGLPPGMTAAARVRRTAVSTNKVWGSAPPAYAQTYQSATPVTASLWYYRPSGTGYVELVIGATKTAGGDYNYYAVSAVLDLPQNSGWQRVSVTLSTLPSYTYLFCGLRIRSMGASDWVWVTGVQIEDGDEAGPYLDGSMSGCRWVGAAHNSGSVRDFVFPERINHVANPEFRYNDTDGWTKANWGGARDTNPPVPFPDPGSGHSFAACMRHTTCYPNGQSIVANRSRGTSPLMMRAFPGERLTLSFWALPYSMISGALTARLVATDRDGNEKGSASWSFPAKSNPPAWQRAQVSLTVPSTASFARAEFVGTYSSGWSHTNYFTGVQLEYGAAASQYLVGSMPGAAWEEIEHRSWSYATAFRWLTASIDIAGGAAEVDDNDVLLTLGAQAEAGGEPVDPQYMRFSDDGETWTDWEPYATTRTWRLPAVTDDLPHERTVYAQYRAVYGGATYDSEVVSDSVTLRVSWVTRALLAGGQPASVSRTMPLALKASSSAGEVTGWRARENGGPWSPWQPWRPRRRGWQEETWTAGGHGRRALEVVFRDTDGNTSPVAACAVTVLSAGARRESLAAAGAQTVVADALVFLRGVELARLRVVDGEVTADARNAIVRTCRLVLAPPPGGDLREVYELLCRPGAELLVRRGWLTADGVDLVPLGRFVPDEVIMREEAGGEQLEVSGSDVAVRVQRARWTDVFRLPATTPVGKALARIIRDRWPDARVAIGTAQAPDPLGTAFVCAPGEGSDPWADAQSLATAHGFFLAPDREGAFRLVEPPDPETATPRFRFPRGATVVGTELVAPLERVYNGVVVSGESPSLERPVSAVVFDTDPASPTSVHGPLGRVPYFWSSPAVRTHAQARRAARRLLSRLLGRLEQLAFDAVPDPRLDPLDAVAVEDGDGCWHLYIVDEVTVGLGPTQAMHVTARETRRPWTYSGSQNS